MQKAGQILVQASYGNFAVLVKGGHLPSSEPASDVLILPHGLPTTDLAERLDTPHTHGTGCALSSAIAAYLALGLSLRRACHAAKRTLTDALRHPVVVGQGRGYPDVMLAAQEEGRDKAIAQWRFPLHGVYFVTGPGLERPPLMMVRAALDGGAKIIQLRDKQTATPELIALAKQLRQMAHKSEATFVVNDRVDVALASDADGVHLGPDDMTPEDARRLLGPEKLLGVSTGTLLEATAAAPHASYFGVGAIYGTQTKADAGDPVGLDRIQEIKAVFPRIPVVTIGGIHAGNIGDVARAGADAAAVVSAVTTAPDMAEATRELVRLFAEGKASLH